MASSGTTVCVYTGYSSTPVMDYFVPNDKGTLWNVFTYDSTNSKITTINALGK